MIKINKTGRIPLSSIGLILKQYIKYFKAYFIFAVIPWVLWCLAFYFTQREIAKSIIDRITFCLMPLAFVGNSSVFDPVPITPSLILFDILSLIFVGFCFSCLVISLKHTFYKKLSIIVVLKEEFKNILPSLIMFFSFSIICVLVTMVMSLLQHFVFPHIKLPNTFLSSLILWHFPLVLLSFFVFYPCIYLFSKNGIFGSLLYSIKTFFSNILIMIIPFIVSICFGLILRYIINELITTGIKLFAKGTFQLQQITPTVIWTAVILFMILSGIMLYIIYVSNIMIALMTFVAYPELLGEDKQTQDTLTLAPSSGPEEEYPSLPTEFFDGDKVKKIHENNNKQTVNKNIYKPVIRTTDAGEGLSVPNTHTSDRPFLNQKLDQTEFDRLTSRERN